MIRSKRYWFDSNSGNWRFQWRYQNTGKSKSSSSGVSYGSEYYLDNIGEETSYGSEYYLDEYGLAVSYPIYGFTISSYSGG